ncbi:hypothetical protein [Sphingomonas sp. KR3-1]|uniref:hypothetical protein n=1 Tax=Sphingomonas sp. KR3-1 TaxID=3156611 RepID=UPI0032B4F6B4
MIVRGCFPLFDTRFILEDSSEDARPAPRWLYAEPPPPVDYVGRLGRVAKWIPPHPYARCTAADLIQLSLRPDEEDHAKHFAMQVEKIEVVADQHGHARLSVELNLEVLGSDRSLAALADSVATADISVRHPERRGQYDTLAGAANILADLYARESARTAPPPRGSYRPDWVIAGRPFLIVVNDRRDSIEFPATLPEVATQGDNSRIRFFPWRPDDDNGSALPIWYLEASRGGAAWRLQIEALEDLTAHYEELFLCTELQIRGETQPMPFDAALAMHRKRLSGTLRRERRHGVDLRAASRILADYDSSILKPRETESLEQALIARVNAQIAAYIGPRGFGNSRTGDIHMTVNNTFTGGNNVVNFGMMANNTITMTNEMLATSQAAGDLKAKLTELRDPVIKAAEALPEAEAKNLLKDYENFADAALRESPPKPLVQAQGNQLVETAKKVAAFATPVATIVAAILKLVAG